MAFICDILSVPQISACERTTSLLDQTSIAKVSKINDGVAKLFEEDFNSLLRLAIVRRNKCISSRPIDDRVRLQIRNGHVVKRLNYSCSRGQGRNELARR